MPLCVQSSVVPIFGGRRFRRSLPAPEGICRRTRRGLGNLRSDRLTVAAERRSEVGARRFSKLPYKLFLSETAQFLKPRDLDRCAWTCFRGAPFTDKIS